jgi:hypothetical protein
MLTEATKTRVVPCSRAVSEGGGVICVRDRLVTVNAGRFYGVCRILLLIGCLSGYRNTGLRLMTSCSVVAVVTSNYTEGLLENLCSSSVIEVCVEQATCFSGRTFWRY